MRARIAITALLGILLAISLAACVAEQGEPGSDSWRGAITTEGDTTTVRNTSGSVWGGKPRLVEEVSIGVAVGPDEYMFGRTIALYASNNRIYVADLQVPAVRVYDFEGTYLRTLGAQGQGPGEYARPSLVTADDNGRVFVYDAAIRRINVYADTGESIESWSNVGLYCCAWPMYPLIWNPGQHGDHLFGAADAYSFEVLQHDGSRLVVERFWEPTPPNSGHTT